MLHPFISSIVFFTDNIATTQTILDTSPHPGQSTSILFTKHMSTFFSLQPIHTQQVTILGQIIFTEDHTAEDDSKVLRVHLILIILRCYAS